MSNPPMGHADSPVVRLTVEVDPSLKRQFKSISASRGESMSDAVEGLLRSYIADQPQKTNPSGETYRVY